MTYKKLIGCRICANKSFDVILDLGSQCLTGYFPSSSEEEVEQGPLVLIKCRECHLVQLKHSFSPEKMYGENYGYRSGLNASMVNHLRNKVKDLEAEIDLENDDYVLDIGSNDGTLLSSYANRDINFVGMDPTSDKFREYYKDDIEIISDFFSSNLYLSSGQKKAKIVTSVSMFYDLEDPISFASDIKKILHPEGIWHFEQSYLPFMLSANSYDTICHEHQEYYRLKEIHWMMEKVGFKIVDKRELIIHKDAVFMITNREENTNESIIFNL